LQQNIAIIILLFLQNYSTYYREISDTVLNNLVRRVLDEVSEHNINVSAHFKFNSF